MSLSWNIPSDRAIKDVGPPLLIVFFIFLNLGQKEQTREGNAWASNLTSKEKERERESCHPRARDIRKENKEKEEEEETKKWRRWWCSRKYKSETFL